MKKYIIGALVIIALIGVFLAGRTFAPQSDQLRGYNPPVQSAQGFIHSLSTSTAIASTDFCSSANVQWLGTTAVATATLPAATSTFVACPTLSNNLGASNQGLIVNDSTNTVDYAVGTGDTVKCETNGVGTSTVTGGCTSSAFSILASTTVAYSVYFDSSSSTFIMTIGNNYK
jgi:hypothetical protein